MSYGGNMRAKRVVLLIAAIMLAAMVFGGCSDSVGGDPVDEVDYTIRVVEPKVGSKVNLANSDVAAFVSAYEKEASARYYGKGDNYKMDGVDLTFEVNQPALYYTVLISRKADMSDANMLVTEEPTAHFDDLFVNTRYYWQVFAAYRSGTVASDIFSFDTADTPRTIDIEGVSNTRDVGGKVTLDGKTMKQGLLYRGAVLDSVTETGKLEAVEKYGIKTEIDLRRANEVGSRTVSPFGEQVTFVHISSPYYVGDQNGIDAKANQESICQYMRVFANRENYPILFHCSAGRDRTGMAAMFVQALCGVSEKDIFIDYEMSFFSIRGCLDGAGVWLMVAQFNATVDYIKENYGESNMTFNKKCELFLLDIGVTAEEISSIRDILLEDAVA